MCSFIYICRALCCRSNLEICFGSVPMHLKKLTCRCLTMSETQRSVVLATGPTTGSMRDRRRRRWQTSPLCPNAGWCQCNWNSRKLHEHIYPLYAESFSGSTNIYLHLVSFLDTVWRRLLPPLFVEDKETGFLIYIKSMAHDDRATQWTKISTATPLTLVLLKFFGPSTLSVKSAKVQVHEWRSVNIVASLKET